MPSLLSEGTALISSDQLYRYNLTRRWGDAAPYALWVMLNPSTATATKDDPTIRRCISFTRALGLDALIVVNLFALRTPDPRLLAIHSDPIGPHNDAAILAFAKSAQLVVAAWGAHPFASPRSAFVQALIGRPLSCLGTTTAGFPRHPLYVKSSQPLLPYPEIAKSGPALYSDTVTPTPNPNF